MCKRDMKGKMGKRSMRGRPKITKAEVQDIRRTKTEPIKFYINTKILDEIINN